ncbi:hypothetical protein EI94DRAFT_1759542 [Lactarius quietus]|nr:hypothetical protein EI94DRAFT_1759542 [Lactarius quietus]
MSQLPPEDVNVIKAGVDPGTGDNQYPTPEMQNKATPGEANFIDGSGPIFSMYMEMATEEDKKMAEAWQADADGILIFTGLFSAAVASLISVSIQDIQQNPQDTSNFYLSNIYRSMADPNISTSLPASPPPFSPPNYAIWVNALWFLSLVISITCALLATLLQQWARRYLKATQPRYSPHKRARIRAFFSEGVDRFLLPWAVEALPTMLHVSLFLFFAGLAVFLWNVNLTIFKLVLSWIGVCTALYGCITLVPLFRHDSPYHTPLSLPTWHIVTGIRLVTFRFLYWFAKFPCFSNAAYYRFQDLKNCYRKMLIQGMQKTAEETALDLPPEIDTRAFMWTFDSLDEDHELERLFAGLPGFRTSKVVKDPLPDLTRDQQGKLLNAWIGLSDRTSSSDLLPERVKSRRIAICARAFDPTDFSVWRVFHRIVSEDQYGPVQSAEIARLVRGWDNSDNEGPPTVMKALVSSVVARAQRRDDLWFAMASNELGVPEFVLRNHATHGDSLSLAILIHITRQQFSCFRELYWPREDFSKVLEAASKFNVLDTSPELQHEFCALWNQIVRKVQKVSARIMTNGTLGRIRNVYLALHQGTDSAPTRFSASTGDHSAILYDPSLYPLCNISAHHLNSTPDIHSVSTSTITAHAVLLGHTTLVPLSPTSTPDAPSSSISAALQVDDSENRMDVPLLDNNVPASFHPTRQTAMESPRIPAISSDPETAVGATRAIETSARTMPPTAPATSMVASSVSSTGTGSLQNTTDLLVHSVAQVNLPSASARPVLDEIPKSHCSILATKSPGASPRPTSAPELGTVQYSQKAGSLEDKDILHPPSVNRTIQSNTVAILDLPPHPPQLRSDTDIAIANPSLRESDAGHEGDHPPHSTHDQYDIV